MALLHAEQLNFLDTFGAVCGALRGGGVLRLCTPPLEEWRQHSSAGSQWCRELERIRGESSWLQFISEGSSDQPTPFLPTPRTAAGDLVPTEDQQELIEAVLRTTSSSPLVILGRRGRGKSAALGVAAQLLLRRGCERITVTSPSLASAQRLLHSAEAAARAQTEQVRRKSAGCLQISHGQLEFISVRELLQDREHLKRCQYLFVDEAAGLPVAEASQLLRKARRVVMATTLDGYDACGQGFLLRALPVLLEQKRQLRTVELQERQGSLCGASSPWNPESGFIGSGT
eukprot:g27977.t1